MTNIFCFIIALIDTFNVRSNPDAQGNGHFEGQGLSNVNIRENKYH